MTENVDADKACEVLREAAQLIREDPNRKHSLLTFPAAGQLVVTGDMHGNLRNFEKLKRFCALDSSPGRSVILHELIHAEISGAGELDRSIELLIEAAAWKCAHPDNVFFMQSNHELAQLRGQEITKGGRSVLLDFELGVRDLFHEKTGDVLDAVCDYIASLPLGVRTENGVFIAHSLPDPLLIDQFDLTLFDRDPSPADLEPGGAAYALVWGRFHTPDVVDHFATRLGVESFIVGHTPQETGHDRIGKLLIIASDHNHGVFLPIDLSKKYTTKDLERALRKFVSVA